MFGTENEDSIPVEIVDVMVASIVLAHGGKIVVKQSVRDRVNREDLVYDFETDAYGDGVITVVPRAQRDERERKIKADPDAFVRELFRAIGMTEEEIDAAIAVAKDL